MKKYIFTTLTITMFAFTITACKPKDSNLSFESSKIESTDSGSAAQTPAKDYTVQQLSSVKKPSKKVTLNTIYKAVKKAYKEDYIPNVRLDKKTLKEVYNLSPNLYQSIIGEVPMISAHSDTFIAVKAKKGKTKAVKKALLNYQAKLKKDTMQYPMNQLKIQASKVVNYGNYVFFILLGQLPENIDESNESAVIKAFEKQNNIAVKAIKKTLGV